MSQKSIRKVFLVYPRFQITLIILNIAIIGVVLLIVGIQTYRSFCDLREMGVQAHLSDNHPYFRFVAYESERFFQNIFFGFLVGILTSSFLTIYLSHRLAGPIVRMKKYFEDLSKLDEPIRPLKFRKMDFFSDLPSVVNRSIEAIQKRSRNR